MIGEAHTQRRPRVAMAAFAASLAALASTTAPTAVAASDTQGKTTVEQRIVPGSGDGFRALGLGPGEGYTVREEGLGEAESGRANRRRSLLYFGQLSDFQLADEESPARVEFIDTGPFSAAWRPWEAMNPQIDDAMVRQVNAFVPASPLTEGDGGRRAMDFAIGTGDLADSQQLNETEWVRVLLEGGPLDPGSGVDPAGSSDPACVAAAPLMADAATPQNYTGVQDFDDYPGPATNQFYDPEQPGGAFAEWPEYPNLLDRAQEPFEAAGLDVPSYVAIGNHDALVQGNAAANAAYEAVAVGCVKPFSPVVTDDTFADGLSDLGPETLQEPLATHEAGFVPPDPRRQFVSKPQLKDVYKAGAQSDGHGFALVDADEEQASAGAAGYYAWSPQPRFRFISLDTVSDAGVIGPSADGNVDHPQFLWLREELERAEKRDQLVVVFSHHAIPSLTADVPDELAPACSSTDSHGHDLNPGCDLDPRSSTPIHLGADLEELLWRHPHAIAWVAGHSHVNSVEPHADPEGGGGFWSIRVAAEADWPQQSRLLEVFDNEDGTLSIFGTILDHTGPATAAGSETNAAGLDVDGLASVGRTISYNDTQSGGRACDEEPCGEGAAEDRNVELLIADPRRAAGGRGRCANELDGTKKAERLKGTPGGDRIRGGGGRDRIAGRGGKDCLKGGRGRDRVKGGGGKDRLGGGKGGDRLKPGKGKDVVKGASGRDRVKARDGKRDVVRCGNGPGDRATVDRKDKVRGCERVRRK